MKKNKSGQRKKLCEAPKGFSLIELMVVIAIVAVLAAISLPVYVSYISRTKIAAAAMVMEGLADQSINFVAGHGRFGNLNDIGIPEAMPDNISRPNGLDNLLDAPTLLRIFHDPSILNVQMGDGNNPPCGASGSIDISIDLLKMGYPGITSSTLGGYFFLYIIWWNYNGVLNKAGYYYGYYYDNNSTTLILDDIIPQWYNIQIPSEATAFNTATATAGDATC